jgi:hypothetical protein
MNLVNLVITRQKETPVERVERFKRERRHIWKEEGCRLLEWRGRLGLPRTFVALETGVGYARLCRLEQGLPVREAKLICRIYEMVLEKAETNKEL